MAEILESSEFKESQKYRDLLTYLVEESLAGRSPKETTLGIQFFGKEASFNSKEDATVRVYLNNLRKKLDHYYLTSGKSASLRLVIPVGHYKVEFVNAESAVNQPAKTSRWDKWALFGLSLVVTFALGYLSRVLLYPQQPAVNVTNPIWTEFTQPNGRPTLVVLGDYFFLRENNPVSSYYRTVTINSPEDFEERVNKEPAFAKRYQPLQFTYLRPSASWGLTQILPILQKSPRGYSMKLASEFTTNDFKSNNIVFIGTLKTLYGIHKFLHIFGMTETNTPYESVAIQGKKGDSLQIFSLGGQRSGDYVKDFSIIAKGAGPDGSTILLLLGVSEHGAIEAPRAACDSTLFEAIESRYPHQSFSQPFYFTLVLSTEGISQTVFGANIRHFIQNKPLYNIANIGHEDSSATR
ncbi:MAG TPA: hypothetical protein VMH23_06845 [Bacteroidota bacterium]|nr:hypothetical protein [Bacteroidota bacterium]